LRSLTRAAYGPQEDGHYALASDCYCHFTSPIRRYPDLTIHRALASLAHGRRPPADGLVTLGGECSDLERRAESAERELVKLKLLNFLKSRIGEEMDAVITGVEAFGLFVQGLALPAEGLVPLDSLPDDTYRYDRASHSLSGRRPGQAFRLGDRLRVAVARVDTDRRELNFRLIGRGRTPKAGMRDRRGGRSDKSRGRAHGKPKAPKQAGKRGLKGGPGRGSKRRRG
jgi:ribonuclease R